MYLFLVLSLCYKYTKEVVMECTNMLITVTKDNSFLPSYSYCFVLICNLEFYEGEYSAEKSSVNFPKL